MRAEVELLEWYALAGASRAIAKIVFFVFLILFAVSVVMHLVRGRGIGGL